MFDVSSPVARTGSPSAVVVAFWRYWTFGSVTEASVMTNPTVPVAPTVTLRRRIVPLGMNLFVKVQRVDLLETRTTLTVRPLRLSGWS